MLNQVFAFPRSTLVRLIHDEPQRDLVWLIDVEADKALPFSMHRTKFAQMLMNNDAQSVPDPKIRELIPDDAMTAAEKENVEALWAAIKPLVKIKPDIFIPRRRGKLLREAHANDGMSRPTLLRGVRLYFQRGMTKAALLPDYRKCGAPGQRRSSEKKLGRPRSTAGNPWVNVSQPIRDLMRKYWKRSYLNAKRSSLRGAYDRFVAEFVRIRNNLPPGQIDEFCKAFRDTPIPTFGQFRYQFLSEFNDVQILMNRNGWRTFNAKLRPLVKNARGETRGIGSRYVIDATVADTHIVSSIDRNRIVGRPTLYLISDVATRVIVGFYVGLEPPSWIAALFALANVFEDKVALCARYGIAIHPVMWPIGVSCDALLSDGGEVLSQAASHIIGVIAQEIETAPPYRGDAKAVVERQFGTLQCSFGPYLPGYVEKPSMERGDRDPRLDAAYTLEAFRKAVILAILQANNTTRRDYDGPPEVIASGTPYIPSLLWKHYEEQHLVDGVPIDPDFATRVLRPREKVAVGRRGVQLAPGLHYASTALLSQPWYLSVAHNRESLVATYDPADISQIEVWSPTDPRESFVCPLTSHSERFKGCSLTEVKALRRREKENASSPGWSWDELGFDPEGIRAFVAGEQEALKREQLRERDAERDPTLSKSARTRAIRDNRRDELRADQQRRLGGYLDGDAETIERDTSDKSSEDPIDAARIAKLRERLTQTEKCDAE